MSSPLGLDASSSVASIVVIGDSNSEGSGATSVLLRWQYLLQQKLRTRMQPVGVTGAVVPYISASPRVSPPYGDYPRTATGGVTTGSYGLGLRAAAVVAGESVTFTFTGTRARLFGTKGSTVGRYSIKLNGGAETVVDGANASVVSGQLIWDSGNLTVGAHSVVVARAASTVTSPGPVFPEGLMVYNGDTSAGVRVVDAARHGATLSTFTGSNAWHAALGAVEGAQLLIMPWGANDSTSGTSASAFKTSLTQMIADTRSAGFAGTVLLLKMPKRGTADAGLWASYMAQVDAVDLADPNVLALDLRDRIPDQGTPEAVAQGLYADEVHFSNAGHALVADVIATALLGDDTSEQFQAQVWAAFGANLSASRTSWSWTDLSPRLTNEPMRLRAGKSAGASQVSPGSCQVTLLNDDGAITPDNPLSPYYPNVQIGVPVQIRIRWAGIWYERAAGHADQWNVEFLPTTTPGEMHSKVRVTSSGILRRLSQGTDPLSSPILRRLTSFSPTGYLPLEDGPDSTVPASGIPGGQPGLAIDVAFAADDTLPGAATSAHLNSAASSLTVFNRPKAGDTAWTFIVYFKLDALPPGPDVTLLTVKTTGTVTDWTFQVSGGGYRWIGTNAAGGVVFDKAQGHGTYAAANTWVAMTMNAVQNGANVDTRIYWHGVGGPGVLYRTDVTDSFPYAGSVGAVTSATVGPSSILPGAISHMAVFGQSAPFITQSFVKLSNGYIGETAGTRMLRLADELKVPLTVIGDPDDTEPMGRQEIDTFLNLLYSCSEADVGVLTEDGFGLAYVTRQSRYNQPVDMTVDLATYCVTSGGQAAVLAPVLGDQNIRNELTVSRLNGSSVVVVDQASKDRHGTYSDSVEVNVAADDQLPDQASFRAHLAGMDRLS